MAATFPSLSPFVHQWRHARPRLAPLYSQAGDSSSPSENERLDPRLDPPFPPNNNNNNNSNNNTSLDKKALEAKRALERAALYRRTNRTSPTNPANSMNQTSPTSPANPTNRTSSANPINPTNPTSSANPTSATNPMNPTSSANPTSATNPMNPTSSANPINTIKRTSSDPTNPTNRTSPTSPGNLVNQPSSDTAEPNTKSLGKFEVEIVTRDGVVKRNASKPGDGSSGSKTTFGPLKRQGVSSVDFLGLDFVEKKGRGKPAGLRAGFEPPPPGFLPEVEIITACNLSSSSSSSSSSFSSVKSEEKESLYKPKVTTWGVFPRPDNISKAFGGGRTIRPGEQLETEEEKQLREARSRKLLEDYKKKMGFDVDPKVKAKCQQALNLAQSLVDSGSLQGAMILFEKVMEQMPYQSELHGLAALEWSISLESMNRTEEARTMYKKLVSHSNASVRRKAKQLLFGFQAMKTLKFSASTDWDALTYRSYFESFADGYDTGFKTNEEEKDEVNPLGEVWVYAIFLSFPLFLVLALILLKGR